MSQAGVEAKRGVDPSAVVGESFEWDERQQVVWLSGPDSRRIADLLLNPLEPTPALVAAVRQYRELRSG